MQQDDFLSQLKNDPLILLQTIYDEINSTCFEKKLPSILLKWNSRLRVAAGRFIPGRSRNIFNATSPTIEIATYLTEETDAFTLVWDTLAHEMIHLWLWNKKEPYGHNQNFKKKMKELGVNRYNTVPRLRPYKYIYECPSCLKELPARKRLGPLACAVCCKTYSGGRWNKKFVLTLKTENKPPKKY